MKTNSGGFSMKWIAYALMFLITIFAAQAALTTETIILDDVVTGQSVTHTFSVANDADAENVTVSHTIPDSYNPSVTPAETVIDTNSSATYTLYFDIPVDESTSNHSIGTLTFTGNVSTTSTEVAINPEEALRIRELDVEVGGRTDRSVNDGDTISKDAEPGDVITFKFEIENTFEDDDDEINDIEVEVTIEDIEQGDDIDLDSGKFDLDGDDKEDIELSFTVPYLVNDDTYTVRIHIEGEDENDRVHEIDWELELEVEKERHKIVVDRASVSPSIISCGDYASVDVRIVNAGDDDEDVRVVLRNRALDIESERSVSLDEGDENSAQELVSFRIDVEDADPSVYPLTVDVYRDDTLEETTILDLTVRTCREDLPSTAGESEFEVKTSGGITAPPAQSTDAFRNSDVYLIILGVIVVLALIGVLFVAFRR